MKKILAYNNTKETVIFIQHSNAKKTSSIKLREYITPFLYLPDIIRAIPSKLCCFFGNSDRTIFNKLELELLMFKELGTIKHFILKTKSNENIAINSGYWNKKSLFNVSSCFGSPNPLKTFGLSPSEIQTVFCTSSDIIDIGGYSFFSSAKYFIGNYNPSSTANKNFTYVYDKQIHHTQSLFIQCIHTPGFTEDSMSYLVTDKAKKSNYYLFFTGHTIQIDRDNKLNRNYLKTPKSNPRYDNICKSWKKIEDICDQLSKKKATVVLINSNTNMAFSDIVF